MVKLNQSALDVIPLSRKTMDPFIVKNAIWFSAKIVADTKRFLKEY